MIATRRLQFTCLIALVCFGIGATAALAAPVRAVPPLPRHTMPAQFQQNLDTQAQIYLLRGLANVFSRGMDEMGARLRGYGFSPHVLNHRGWQNSADTIARNYRNGRTAPIILIGHSLGANAAYRIARRLNGKGIPVAYLAIFDPTHAVTVPNNVQSFVNFYQNNGHGRRASFPAARQKDKVNLNLTNSPGLTHTNIDQSPRLQNIVINRVLEITRR